MSTQDHLVIAGREFRSRLITGTGKYDTFETMRDALGASGSRDRHGRRPAHRPRRARRRHHRVPARRGPAPAEHVRLRDGRGGGAHRAPRAGRRAAGLGEARGDPRPALPAPGSGRDAARRGGARRGRLHRPAVRAPGPGAPEEARGGRLRHGDAAGRADRDAAAGSSCATRSGS